MVLLDAVLLQCCNGAVLVQAICNGAVLVSSRCNGAMLVQARYNGAAMMQSRCNGAASVLARCNGCKRKNTSSCHKDIEVSTVDSRTAYLEPICARQAGSCTVPRIRTKAPSHFEWAFRD